MGLSSTGGLECIMSHFWACAAQMQPGVCAWGGRRLGVGQEAD